MDFKNPFMSIKLFGIKMGINPARLHGGTFHTYQDHRMATAGAILGLRVPGIVVENIETTGKTLPNFTHRWEDLLNK